MQCMSQRSEKSAECSLFIVMEFRLGKYCLKLGAASWVSECFLFYSFADGFIYQN